MHHAELLPVHGRGRSRRWSLWAAAVLVVAGMASTAPAGSRVVGTDQPAPLRLVENLSAGAVPAVSRFLLDNGRYTTINAPGAVFEAAPTGVNDLLVGSESAPTGYALGGRGFLLENDGRLRPVNIPGATGTAPLGINVRGQIVGS